MADFRLLPKWREGERSILPVRIPARGGSYREGTNMARSASRDALSDHLVLRGRADHVGIRPARALAPSR